MEITMLFSIVFAEKTDSQVFLPKVSMLQKIKNELNDFKSICPSATRWFVRRVFKTPTAQNMSAPVQKSDENQMTSLNKELTDSSLAMRIIVSPNNFAQLSWRILLLAAA